MTQASRLSKEITMINSIFEDAKLKKTHFSQNSKMIISLKKDLSQAHMSNTIIRDPVKRVSLADGIPISKSKLSFMGTAL